MGHYYLKEKKMGKIRWIFVMLIVFSMFCTAANAAEDLTDWSHYTEDEGSYFTVSGTTATISQTSLADGCPWSRISKYYENATGIMATVNVSDINTDSSEAYGHVGLRKNVASTSSGTLILAEIDVNVYEGAHRIRYRLRERTEDGTTVAVLTNSFFGSFDGGMWETGEDVVIGLGVVGNDVCFYASESEILAKITLDFEISPVERSLEITGCAESGGSISAEVSNVTVLYGEFPGESEGTGATDGVKVTDVNVSGTYQVGSPMTISATAYNESGGTIYYRFGIVKDYGTASYDPSTWTAISDYTTNARTVYTFTEAGSYIFTVTASLSPEEPSEPKPMLGGCITITE